MVIRESLETPVAGKSDVIVVGGGPGGVAAAIAAAKNGARTLLIERSAFLGGLLTGGLILWLPIDKVVPQKAYGEDRPLQGGIITEFLERMTQLGGAPDPADSYGTAVGFEAYFPTDPEISKVVLQQMARESGAELLLHTLAVGAIADQGKVKGVITESKSGRQAFLADVVVDASGDADIAASAGAPYEKHEAPLLMSLVAAMGNVDTERAIPYSRLEGRGEFDALVEEAVRCGDLSLPMKKVLPEMPEARLTPPIVLDQHKLPATYYRRGEACGWVGHYLGDGTNVRDLTKAEIETRQGLVEVLQFFRKYVPGYERAYLSHTGAQIGLRESRRILGDYVLTADNDMRTGRAHSDVVVRCRTGAARDLSLYTPQIAPVFDIPYRCIVPKSVSGLLVAGRCISIDHAAATLLSPRDESTCMCLGEAAGTAAALCSGKGVQPRDLDITDLQQALRRKGANV